jgi:hypothetical protein
MYNKRNFKLLMSFLDDSELFEVNDFTSSSEPYLEADNLELISQMKKVLPGKKLTDWPLLRNSLFATLELKSNAKCLESLAEALSGFERVNKLNQIK